MNYGALVAKPANTDINSGLSPLNRNTLIKAIGMPRSTFDTTCQPVTNLAIKRRLVTQSVGPFRVTGLDCAVNRLALVFQDIQKKDAALYAAITTAGMLCARYTRGTEIPSIHSWGCAVDLGINGVLVALGDPHVQMGLLAAYPYFHAHGFYWGAGFSRVDAMHFELAEETFRSMAGLGPAE